MPQTQHLRLLYLLAAIGTLWIVSACTPADVPGVIELTNVHTQQAAAVEASPQVIYVTPTQIPTMVSTVALASATPVPSSTPQHTPTTSPAEQQAACSAVLDTLYAQASELCLGQPEGYFCNGGLAPNAEPAGPVRSALSVQGAVVPAEEVTMVHSAPLISNNSGGLLWLRLADEVAMSALLVGDVELRDVTPADANLPAWQSFTVTTRDHEQACSIVPHSLFVMQGPYGQTTRVAINGVSAEVNGTLAVQTSGTETAFIALEGTMRLTIFGQIRLLSAGEQLNVTYPAGSFERPAAIPEQPAPLDVAVIQNLPIALLDRPVLLPQPGSVITQGNVNMRAEPNEGALLLYEVPSGTALSVLGMNSERTWVNVRLGNGETGWMRADLVSGDLSLVTLSYDNTPLPPQRYGQDGNQAVVIAASGGNLRSAPDVGFPVLNTLEPGTELSIIARSPYSPWVKVDTGGTIGWMALITLETQVVIPFLPIDYDVPLPPGPTATPFLVFGGGHAYPDPTGGQ